MKLSFSFVFEPEELLSAVYGERSELPVLLHLHSLHSVLHDPFSGDLSAVDDLGGRGHRAEVSSAASAERGGGEGGEARASHASSHPGPQTSAQAVEVPHVPHVSHRTHGAERPKTWVKGGESSSEAREAHESPEEGSARPGSTAAVTVGATASEKQVVSKRTGTKEVGERIVSSEELPEHVLRVSEGERLLEVIAVVEMLSSASVSGQAFFSKPVIN